MSSKPPGRHPSSAQRTGNPSPEAIASLRQLFDSLSSEQRRNQDLLVSLGFALRSFTNLQRFLELVPVVASRLVGVEGALLVPFQSDGRLWRDQLQGSPAEPSQDCLLYTSPSPRDGLLSRMPSSA